MCTYRLHYCDVGGNRFASHAFEAQDDAAAIGRARRLAQLKAPVLEVTKNGQLVYQSNPSEGGKRQMPSNSERIREIATRCRRMAVTSKRPANLLMRADALEAEAAAIEGVEFSEVGAAKISSESL